VVSITTGGGSGSPGGSDTQVQFNDSTAFGGDAGFTYDKSTAVVSLDNLEAVTFAFVSFGGAFGVKVTTTDTNSILVVAGNDPAGGGIGGSVRLDSGTGDAGNSQGSTIIALGAVSGTGGSVDVVLGVGSTQNGAMFVTQGSLVLTDTSVDETALFGAGVIDKCIVLTQVGSAPTGNLTNSGILYVDSGALMYRGSSGTVTPIAPA